MARSLVSPRIYAAQALALARTVMRVSHAYRASPLRIARLARRARAEDGYEYPEALASGPLDPSAPPELLGRHASKHATLDAQRRVNPEEFSPLTEEKAIFYRFLEAAGLPSPRLLGVIVHGTGWGRGGVVTSLPAFSMWRRAAATKPS